MKLTVLVDNNTLIDKEYCGEPGWSAFIEADGKKILLDTGYTDIFIKNAKAMGIDLCDLDYIVFSHGHFDHTWGLKHLIELYKSNPHKTPTLIATENAFDEKIDDDGCTQIGCDISLDEIKKYINVTIINTSFKLTENLIFLGYIVRTSDFENKVPIGKTILEGELVDDYILDDTALVYKVSEGMVVITGCSHSGITNIVEMAKKVTGATDILDIIGGFHLFKKDAQQIAKTAAYLKSQNIKVAHPCHCADLVSKIEISKVVPIEEVGVGLELNF